MIIDLVGADVERRFMTDMGIVTVYAVADGEFVVTLNDDFIDRIVEVDRDLGHTRVTHYKVASSKRSYHQTIEAAALTAIQRMKKRGELVGGS